MESHNNIKEELKQEDLENNKKKEMSRDFKGIWIPREIWLREDLHVMEKMVWAEIDSLYDKERGGCFASNDYLVEFFGIKKRRLQDIISNLKSKGLIEQVAFDGRERILKAVDPKVAARQRCTKMHPSGALKCTHITKTIYKEISSKEDTKKETASKDAAFLFKYFENKYKKMRESKGLTFKKIQMTKTQLNSLEQLLKNHTLEHIKRIIDAALEHDFWYQHVNTPSYLKTKFVSLETLVKPSKKPKKSFTERWKSKK